MGTCGSKPNMVEEAGSKNVTPPGQGNGTRYRATRVSAGRPVAVLCAVLLLVTVGAVLFGLPEVTNLIAGTHRYRHGEVAYPPVPANNASDRLTQTPSTNTFVSSIGVFDPKFGIDPDQGFFMGALETSRDGARLLRVQGPGRCWNPHPGPFRSWNGMQNGCLIQVWRQWQDGCTHFQWFNTCYNVWDPQIYWTYCIH